MKADNYNYTKNITNKHKDTFHKVTKHYAENKQQGNYKVLEISASDNIWGDFKRTIAQVYDYLKKKYSKIEIVYDGNKKFQFWIYSDNKNINYLKKDIHKKFRGSPYHSLKFLNKSKRIDIYKINNSTGLVSTDVARNKILNFKRKDSTIDKVYKKLTNKNFKWNIKKGINMDNDRIAKKVKDYFSFVQDQLKEMYGGKVKSPMQLEDRDRKNFFKQVRKVWKDKK